jgi:hypothetical protein
MARQSKGFLNLNRFKSGKAIKRRAKQRAANSRNKSVREGAYGQSK